MTTVVEPASTGVTQQDLTLALVVVRLFDRVKHTIREVGDELGLSMAQLDVLRRLQAQGPTRMSRLAEMLNCEASNLTGLVDKLENRGMVERRVDPEDRRIRVLAVTPEGERVGHQAWFELTQRCPFMNISEEKRAELYDLLTEALDVGDRSAGVG
jgi:DNA-binding MarR family transcriptional regulator